MPQDKKIGDSKEIFISQHANEAKKFKGEENLFLLYIVILNNDKLI